MNPGIYISTKEAYTGISPKFPITSLTNAIEQPKEKWQELIINDFESGIIKRYDRLKVLRDNLKERLYSYPEGTRFMSEVTIYNGRNVAGTVDFLAIMPDGKTDILDWKFKDINTDFYEDIPWYNIASWNRKHNFLITIFWFWPHFVSIYSLAYTGAALPRAILTLENTRVYNIAVILSTVSHDK